jgi:monoamine oxidase
MFRGKAEDEVVQLAVQSVASIFGRAVSAVADQLKAVYTHDWSSDPYSRGAYSYGGVGWSRAVRTLRQPVAKTLFLAGEALAGEGRNATVPGALETGYSAATAVLEGSVASSTP